MRVRSVVFLLPVLALTLLGCEKSPRDKLQGTWVGEGVAQLHPSQAAKADGWARGTTLAFNGNKVTVALPAEPARTGTFKIAKTEGKELEVVFKRPEGGEDRSRVRFSDDGKLLWTIGGGVQLVMHRQGE